MGEHKRKKHSGYQRISKGSITTIIIVACVAGVVAVDFLQRSKNSPLTQLEPTRTKGELEAPLQIVEFIDFQCSECARGSKFIQSYMNEYPDGIRLSIKYFPLGEINSNISAVYAECAARQDNFWRYHDILFDRQLQWRTLIDAEPFLKIMAKDAGIDITELEECTKTKEVQAVVMQEHALGESYFVMSTPTYFINGEMVVGVESMKDALQEFFEGETEDLL